MPFDGWTNAPVPVDAAPLHGVPRHRLVEHAMAQVPPALPYCWALQTSAAGGGEQRGLQRGAGVRTFRQAGTRSLNGIITSVSHSAGGRVRQSFR